MKKIITIILLLFFVSSNAHAFIFLLLLASSGGKNNNAFAEKSRLKYHKENNSEVFIVFDNLLYSISKNPITNKQINKDCDMPNLVDINKFYRYTVSWSRDKNNNIKVNKDGMYGSFWIKDKYSEIFLKKTDNISTNAILLNAIGIVDISKDSQYKYLKNYTFSNVSYVGTFDTFYFYKDVNNTISNAYGTTLFKYSLNGKKIISKEINFKKAYLICKKGVVKWKKVFTLQVALW